MRILVGLIAVFMVSGAVAEVDYDMNDVEFTDTSAKCQFKSKGPSGPIYACKDPKTGESVSIECKVPPKMKAPTTMTPGQLPSGIECKVPPKRK